MIKSLKWNQIYLSLKKKLLKVKNKVKKDVKTKNSELTEVTAKLNPTKEAEYHQFHQVDGGVHFRNPPVYRRSFAGASWLPAAAAA